jgi:hypothetical protein
VILQKLSSMGHMTTNVDAMTVKTWVEGLQDMSPEMLKNGLKKAMDFTGYMTLPTFRELCRFQPDDFGIPAVRDSFDMVYKTQYGKQGKLLHPVCYQAVKDCGLYELQNLSEKDSFRRYEFYFSSAAKRFMAGEPMDMPAVQVIPEKVERPKTAQELELQEQIASQSINSLKKLLGL